MQKLSDDFINLNSIDTLKETRKINAVLSSEICTILYYVKNNIKRTPETDEIINYLCDLGEIGNDNARRINARIDALKNE